MCLFCSVSFVGCVPLFTPNPGGGGSRPSKPSEPDDDEEEDEEYGEDDYTIENYNDVFAGIIGVYELDNLEDAFYDKYMDKNVNFDFLVNRQFDAMATYLFNGLNKIYGANPPAANSIEIGGYSTNNGVLQVSYNGMITDANQNILAGISTGNLENSNLLNYKNAINGGYDLEIVKEETTDESGNTLTSVTSCAYSTTKLLDGTDGSADYSWKCKDATYFNKDNFKKALAYIYQNQQDVLNPDAEISFANDADINLKSYYKDFQIESVGNFDISQISMLGITRKYIWNVAYFIAYSIIGENNITNSLNGQNIIFSNNKINSITGDNPDYTVEKLEEVYESYKGYHIVIGQMISNMMRLSVGNTGTNNNIVYGDISSNWDTTLFPSLASERYIFYDDVADICDAQGVDYDDETLDWDNMDQYKTEPGTAYRLKRMILIPHIDHTQYVPNEFDVQGAMMSFMSVDSGEYFVKISYNAIFDSTTEGGDSVVKVYEKDAEGIAGDNYTETNGITFDNVYDSDNDDIDVEMHLKNDKFGNDALSSIQDGSKYLTGLEVAENSFTNTQKTINYDSWDSRTITLGVLNVYNQLFKDGELSLVSNYMIIDFEYYQNGNLLLETPLAYLMMFELYSS